MYRTIWYIIKKECSRFLKDRRMIFTVIILPALLMYGMYTLMGKMTQDTLNIAEDYVFKCYVQNAPVSYDSVFEALNFEVTNTEDVSAAKDSVTQKDADLVVIFPIEFDQQLLNPAEDGSVPNIQVYYNYDKTESNAAYEMFLTATEQLETSIANVLDVNRDVDNPNIAAGSSLVISLMPMMVVSLLFTSCAACAPESVAGEKERGTFATLLVTPVSRTAIAIGKIISLSIFATLAGLSNFIGMILGMRNMFPDGTENIMPIYGPTEYALLLLLIVSAVLMTIAIISVISAFSKSVKEATSAATMVTAIASLASMVTRFPFVSSALGWRCIPIWGTAISLTGIFMMEYSVSDITVTCASNLVFMIILVIILSKMFNSEKIMFNKG